MNSRKTRIHPLRKAAGIFLSLATVMTAYAGFGTMDNSPVSTNVNAAVDYGLMDTCQEGVILHAWQWSFNNIKANMKQIAEAGYTSVQTSVIQQAKEGTKGKTNEVWWVYYQPANFTIDNTGDSALGTKAEFAAMCEEAHKYGIHVIVDVVANHLGNQTKYDISTAVPADIRNDKSCWHSTNFNSSDEIDYNSRYSITHGSMGGLPDLNTENTKIQTYVINYLKECIDSGADGFRFDAAKHISINSEGSEYTFWPNVIGAAKSYYKSNGYYDSLYCYGEILGGLSGSATVAAYNKYMSVTDDSTGNTIRGYVNSGNAAGAARPSYDKGVSADNLVLWAESHDTYSGEDKLSTNISTSVINKTWALVASRNKASALYFARTEGYRSGNIGTVYSKQCFNKEVVEVNKFHNVFNGKTEYLAYSGNIAYNERGTSGVVLVNVGGGSASVSVTANKMAAGTYIDHVTGNTFTVANGKITGTIGSTGIAVVYGTSTASVYAEPGDSAFTGDTLTITLKSSNVTSAKYSTSEGASGTYSSGTKITIGSKTAMGSAVTVTLTGTASDGSTVTEKYVYKKMDFAQLKVYFDNSSYGWKKVYAYIYYAKGDSVIQNAAWPGVEMTFDKQSGYYALPVDDSLMNGNVIFTESSSATTNRYPGDGEKGMQLSGEQMLFGANHSWTVYSDIPEEMKNTSKLSSDKIKLGETVNVLAGYTGGAGDVEYAVYYKRISETDWATAQSYSSNSKISIKPKYATVFDVCVKARDRKGTVVKKYLELFVSSATNKDFTNLSKISSHTVPLGQSITVKCANEGGKNVTYAVYYKPKTSSSWTTAQKYSSNTSVAIKPKTATTYYVCVTAKDGSGNIAKLYMNLTVTANANSTLSNTSSVSKTSVKVNEVITLKGSCVGGKGTKKYAFYDKLSTQSKYATIQSYGTGNTVNFKFSSAGKYTVSICVKDSDNTVAKKRFTIIVK